MFLHSAWLIARTRARISTSVERTRKPEMQLGWGWQRRNRAAKRILLPVILRLWNEPRHRPLAQPRLKVRAGGKEKVDLQLELSCQRKQRAAKRISPRGIDSPGQRCCVFPRAQFRVRVKLGKKAELQLE